MGGSKQFQITRPGNVPHFFPFFFDFNQDANIPRSHLGPPSEEWVEVYPRWEGTTFTGICEFRH